MDKIGQFLQNFQKDPNQVSSAEVATQFSNVASQLPPQDYQQIAEQALSKLSPQQRQELGKQLMEQAQQQRLPFPDVNRDGIDDRLQDPAMLAGYTAQLQQSQPNFFSQALGSGTNPMIKLALGGIAALGLGRLMGGGHHGGGGIFSGGHHGGGGIFGGGHHGGGHH